MVYQFKDDQFQPELLCEVAFQHLRMVILLVNPRGEILHSNPFMAQLSGYEPDQIAGMNWFEQFLLDRDRERIREAFGRKLRGMATEFSIYPFLTVNGEERLIEWQETPFRNRDGGVVGLLITGHDITRQIEIEQQIQQVEKLEAIGQLAGGIAHDFNNILGGIIGYTDLSLRGVDPGSRIERNLKRVLEAADRAKKLVKQILTYSRQGHTIQEHVVPKKIIQEVLALLRSTLPASITIIANLQESGEVKLDKVQICQMMLNLGANAATAMNHKGVLEVTLKEREIVADQRAYTGTISPGVYVVLGIKDSGLGMDQKVLKRIFDPFYTTQSVKYGTGMGLPVVLGIVQDHMGYIDIDTAPGSGTLFEIYLPVINSGMQKGEVSDSEGLLNGSGERIVFIDDEEMLVEITGEMLSDLGYRFKGFVSSCEALNYIEHHSDEVDLVITDQTMPEITGMELAREILNLPGEIPVILCTGNDSSINPVRMERMGIIQSLSKPVGINDLTRVLRDVLTRFKG